MTLTFTETDPLGSTATTTHPGIVVNSACGNDTGITANLTADGSAPVGPAQLTLTTAVGSDSIAIAVIAAQPIISSISPDKGPSTGETPVTITGSHFTPGTTVTIGGNPATDVVFVDFETLTAKTPIGPEQQPPVAVDVTVANPNGSGTLTNGSTYVFGLPHGRTVSAAINSIGETDECAFNGVTGRECSASADERRTAVTASADRRIQLYDPAGVLVGSVAVLDVTLSSAGTNEFDSGQ